MHEFFHEVILHGFLDSLSILPFLFLTYLLMEWLEHKAGGKAQQIIGGAGRFGPVLGGVLGIIPQCGMSTMASNLYTGRVITLGTMVAVFLSTSDEMLPLLVAGDVPFTTALALILYKLIVAVLVGFGVDLALSAYRKKHGVSEEGIHVHEVCEEHGCHCERGIWISALIHTVKIFLFLLIVTFAINAIVLFLGEDWLAAGVFDIPVLSHLICALLGLVPNCAVSVLLTKFYMAGYLSAGAMLAGLLPGAGVGLAVLLRMNKNSRHNSFVVALLVFAGVLFGVLADLTPLRLLFALPVV